VEASGATLLHVYLHPFEQNGGISGVAVLAESHISIHSWPEHGYAAVDVFMCGSTRPERCVDVLRKAFRPQRVATQQILRGAPENGREWIAETIVPGIRFELEANRLIERRKTAYQELVAFENEPFGRVLLLDGAVQVTTADEFVYHEMMAHVPLLAHGHAAEVLIVGGGDCALAEEVLKHPEVSRVTQVEIDPEVVELARAHFSALNAPVFRDDRFRLEIGDGARFLEETDARFDVVLVDSTDPVGPGAVLFTERFFRSVRRRLKPGGVLVNQCGVPFLQRKEFAAAMQAMAGAFPIVGCYVAAVPSYTGGHLAMGWASDSLSPEVPVEQLVQRAAAMRLETRYYTPEVHRAAFVLPRYIAELLPCAKPGESRRSS